MTNSPSVAGKAGLSPPSPGAKDLRLRTCIATMVVVLANASGNFFLSWGLKQRAAAVYSPRQYLEVLLSPWVSLGVLLLILWMLSRTALLSWADLSFVLPVTAVGYVLAAVSGRVLLGEQVSRLRWMGTLLIMAGIVLVGSTSIRTHQAHKRGEPERAFAAGGARS